MGYSFSYLHVLGYTTIALQELNLYNKYPHIYWNTGVLIANIGLDDEGGTVDYGKLAKAIANIQKSGTKIAPPDVNNSDMAFKANPEKNVIEYGLGAIAGVSQENKEKIIANRPYSSFEDFVSKVDIPNKQMIACIKSHMFNAFGSPKDILLTHCHCTTNIRKTLGMVQVPALASAGLIPDKFEKYIKLNNFNNYCKKILEKSEDKLYYILDDRAMEFIDKNYPDLMDGDTLEIKPWTKVFNKEVKPLKDWLKENKESLVLKLREVEAKNKFIEEGGLDSYESYQMSTLNCYLGRHDLARVSRSKYGIQKFESLEGKQGKFKICGTIIVKERTHSSITILTPEFDTVTVQMSKAKFSALEKENFFNRHNMVILEGARRGSRFSAFGNIYLVSKIDEKLGVLNVIG